MSIRRTKTKTLDQGGGYYTYRVVESTRVGGQVKQRILLNLGKDFSIPVPDNGVCTKSPASPHNNRGAEYTDLGSGLR